MNGWIVWEYQEANIKIWKKWQQKINLLDFYKCLYQV